MPRIFDSRREHFGWYLDEYEPGDVFKHWPGHTITEAEDHMFCLLTRAVSPLACRSHFRRQRERVRRAMWLSAPSSIRCCLA